MNEGFNPNKIDVMKSSPVEANIKLNPTNELGIFQDEDGHTYYEKEIRPESKRRQNIEVERFVSMIVKGNLHSSDIIEKDGKYYSRDNFKGNSEKSKEREAEAEIFILKYLFGDWDHTLDGWDIDSSPKQNNISADKDTFAHFDYGEAFRNFKKDGLEKYTNFTFSKRERTNKFKDKIIFLLDHPGFIDPVQRRVVLIHQHKYNYDRPADERTEEQLSIKTNSLLQTIQDRRVEDPESGNTQDFFNAVIKKAKLDLNNRRFSFLTGKTQQERVDELRDMLTKRLALLETVLRDRKNKDKPV
ncbi:MAG: hypothetical protein WCG55_03125 [bacterium]